jgi:transcriptional regulator with XRE-family HTH domain
MTKGLGKQLREARERHVLTQDELAEQLGIPVRSLQDYEAERAVPRPTRRRKILAWLEQSKALEAVA